MTRKEWKDLKRRAKAGDSEARWEVGAWLEDGVTTPEGSVLVRRNARDAVHWYRLSAVAGHSGAQLNLGNMLSRGRGVRQDNVEALHWYKCALRQGNTSAPNNIATVYRDQGDQRRAFLWYQRAVAMGDGDALVEVGKRCYNGIGVRTDPVKAVACFRKAIASNLITQWQKEEAMIHLGVAYLEGSGVRQSLTRSLKWVSQANRDGDHSCAQDLIERINNHERRKPVP